MHFETIKSPIETVAKYSLTNRNPFFISSSTLIADKSSPAVRVAIYSMIGKKTPAHRIEPENQHNYKKNAPTSETTTVN